MPRCIQCKKWGLFLKLQNGRCSSCYNLYLIHAGEFQNLQRILMESLGIIRKTKNLNTLLSRKELYIERYKDLISLSERCQFTVPPSIPPLDSFIKECEERKANLTQEYRDNDVQCSEHSNSVQIPEYEKKYYRPDSYYTTTKPVASISFNGEYGLSHVITFDERKKISYPSKSGLYVGEILLLHYCSYGTYPHPQNGYPGFWWFEYGIRDVGSALKSLEDRGYIEYCTAVEQLPKLTVPQLKEIASKFDMKVSGKKALIIEKIRNNIQASDLENAISERKYKLTDKGEIELKEYEYVPYMHKCPYKTEDSPSFGPGFNVWTINRRIGNSDPFNWKDIVSELQRFNGFPSEFHSEK